MTKGRGRAIVGYCMLTLLGAGAMAWAVITGLARLDLLGDAVQVRITECHSEGGGRGGSHTVCSGPEVGYEAHTVKVPYGPYEDHVGAVVRAVRKPWGGYEPVQTDLVAWGTWVLMPVLPLIGTAAAGALTAREIHRARQEARWRPRARSGHGGGSDGSGEAPASV